MQVNTSSMGGVLRSSFFSALIYCNFIFSACFIIVLVAEGVQSRSPQKNEMVQQKPLQQSVSGGTVTLVSMP